MGISIEIISPDGFELRVNVGKLGMALSVSGSVFQAGNSTMMQKPPEKNVVKIYKQVGEMLKFCKQRHLVMIWFLILLMMK